MNSVLLEMVAVCLEKTERGWSYSCAVSWNIKWTDVRLGIKVIIALYNLCKPILKLLNFTLNLTHCLIWLIKYWNIPVLSKHAAAVADDSKSNGDGGHWWWQMMFLIKNHNGQWTNKWLWL